MLSASVGFATVMTGSNSAILQTVNGGRSWQMVFPTSAWHGVTVIGSTYLVHPEEVMLAVQSSPNPNGKTKPGPVHILVNRPEGSGWLDLSNIALPPIDPLAQNVYFDMQTSSLGEVMIQPAHGMGSEPGVLYQTTDGGRHWTFMSQSVYPAKGMQATLPNGGSIRFITPTDGWLLAGDCSTCPPKLYWTNNSGKSWVPLTLSVPATYAQDGLHLLTSPFSSGTAGVDYAYGFTQPHQGLGKALLFRFTANHPDGQFVAKIPEDLGGIAGGVSRPGNIDFLSSQMGFTFATGSGAISSGTKGSGSLLTGTGLTDNKLFKTTDGGVHWHALPGKGLPTTQNAAGNLQMMDFVSPQVGYIVWQNTSGTLDQSVVFKTTDGGQRFTQIMVAHSTSIG